MIDNFSPAAWDQANATADQAEYVLRVFGLEKGYQTGFWRRRKQALAGISFVVPRGSIFALLGHNGAGKTTTLKCILDLVHPDAGTIEIFGQEHGDERTRARIGYLPESPSFYEHLSAEELLDFYGSLFDLPQSHRRARVREVLEMVSLTADRRMKLRKYSKGMLQRLGIAQAILNDPDLLVLDEPMSGLDPLGRRETRDLLRSLQDRGKSIILSSHIVPDVEALADSVGIITQGRLHTTYDLTAQRDKTQFEVLLGSLAKQSALEALLQESGCQLLEAGTSALRIEAPDVGALQKLLALCERNLIPVQAVTSRQLGLEETFLAALQARNQASATEQALAGGTRRGAVQARSPAGNGRPHLRGRPEEGTP